MPTWAPQKEWLGQDAYLIGGGASLIGFDFSELRSRNTIGCNDAYKLGPGIIKFCIFGDSAWWQQNKFELEKCSDSIRIVSICESIQNVRLSWLHQLIRVRDGLHNGTSCGWNYSTGAAAINLAINLGADRIYLLGYDLAQKGGKTHWHTHRKGLTQESSFKRFSRGFSTLAMDLQKYPGVQILNVTDGTSRLDSFPRISFDEWKEVRR